MFRGVAVDAQGFIFVVDSGNNRIQIFNPDGTFLRAFGRWGQNDGEFKGLEGIKKSRSAIENCLSKTNGFNFLDMKTIIEDIVEEEKEAERDHS